MATRRVVMVRVRTGSVVYTVHWECVRLMPSPPRGPYTSPKWPQQKYQPTQVGWPGTAAQAPPSRMRHLLPMPSSSSCGIGCRGAARCGMVLSYRIRTSFLTRGSRRQSTVWFADFQHDTVLLADQPQKMMFGSTADQDAFRQRNPVQSS